MAGEYVVYGAGGSGSVAVEAALTLLGLPYRVIEAAPWGDAAQQAILAEVSPLKQTPVVDLPSGERMTESAAILLHLGDTHPEAGLAPVVTAPERPAYLRWMSFIPANIYAMYALRDDPGRWLDDPQGQAALKARATEKIGEFWSVMEAAVEPRPYLLGPGLTLLDVYAAVVSRWSPGRAALAERCPKIASAVQRVDADPQLAALWAERFPPA